MIRHDSAMHIVRVNKLGVPQSSRDAFELLEQAGLLSSNVSKKMKAMIGFRNIAVHDDQKINLDIMEMIIRRGLCITSRA
ncbi:hypothetical protein A9Q82_05470 [Cycloclasticus sp. 46_120_T64]|nr:hypothetical protein A9Q82_05470 [Cycloclasticus sp. 46_120_T64]